MIRFLHTTLAIMLLAMVEGRAQEGEKEIDPAGSRELIRQWVQTERLISEEKTAWQVQKQQMQQLLGIYQQELNLLDEELKLAGASAELVDENKEKRETGLTQYRKARQWLGASMTRLLPRMQKLIVRFPKPLLDELSAELGFLNSPEALEQPRDVLKSIIAVLNAASRFNRSITLVEETRSVSEEKKVTVNVIYLGLCRAYYTSDSGPSAGVGVPAKEGWSWSQLPEIADDVRSIIAVYRKAAQPQIIELPVQLLTIEGESIK